MRGVVRSDELPTLETKEELRIKDAITTPFPDGTVWGTFAAYADFGVPVETYVVDREHQPMSEPIPLLLRREGDSLVGDAIQCTVDRHGVATGVYLRIPGTGEQVPVFLDRTEICFAGQLIAVNNVEIYLSEE